MKNPAKGKGDLRKKAKRKINAFSLFTFFPLRLFTAGPWAAPSKKIALLILLATFMVSGRLPLAASAAAAPEKVLEELQYRVDVWFITAAARARLIFKSLGNGRYRAEVAAEAQGVASLLSGQRRDNYVTEMNFQDGRLMPLVYREESRRWGKHHLKEYRFDYEKNRLELWQLQEGKGLGRKWETALTDAAIYDPLSAFYNLRLGALPRPAEGESVRLQGIPYPRPEEIVVRMGALAPQGRKVMVRLINRVFNDEGVVVFVFFDKQWAPSQAWTRILSFGKVAAAILPGSRPLQGSLPEMPSAMKSSRFQGPGSKPGE